MVAILRHDVLDIDLVVRRSIIYGALSLIIAGVYVAVAAAPGLALGSRIPVQVAVVVTILAAVVFQPLRRRLESLADRWVFGERVNRYELLTAFGASLEQTLDLGEMVPRLADTVRRGLGAGWVRVSLSGTSTAAGEPTGDVGLTVPLECRGRTIGRIECGVKSAGYEPGDAELLATLAGQAATTIANVQLTAELAERLEELARSRARIVAAQDLERQRIERDIHDGVQQHVVVLIARLRLARNQLGRGERSLDEVLSDVQADARELLTDLRELAHGIHPAVLSDRGLVAAVEARADRLPLAIDVRVDPALRLRRFGADVEATAYFVVCEALTNVVKHACTHAARIALSTMDGRLEIVISDDGSGYSATPHGGRGLTNLRDRVDALGGLLHVEGSPGAGTRIRAELPLAGSAR
jgi:signal transduction histidine kinase